MKPTPEQARKSVEALTQLVELLGFTATISSQPTDREIVLNVDVDEPGRFIGKGGQYITNLELIVNRVLQCQEGRYPYISLNVEGYRRQSTRSPRRSDERGERGERSDEGDAQMVCRQAQDAAKEVKKWGETKSIGPFTSWERRAIHMALREDPEVVTSSGDDEGRGRKKVIISLAGKDSGAA